MPRVYSACLGRRCLPESEDELAEYLTLDSDVEEAESTLGGRGSTDDDVNEYFKSPDSYQSSDGKRPTQDRGNDSREKKLKRKQKRKEMRKRAGHVLHSSWKWFKRGLVAISPTLTSMFAFAPSPATIIHATAAARRDADRCGRRMPVFL
ncbi:unnamed protein product [Lymnaea stagnalis]|uniref:Uncharacterized protein n=1 Tax=Lymnaea stagnalis TaxID=6523 RepID=A0AAV2HK46_LYMST